MPGRNAQVSRVYAELLILEGAPQGLTVKELAERLKERGFNEKTRTIYRDLELLRDSGFALIEVEDKADSGAVRWKLERLTRVTDHFMLSPRELLALYLARGALTPLKETYFYEDLHSIFQKIQERLGEKNCRHLDELGTDFHFEPGPRWGLGIDPDTLETVRAACAERQWFRAVYDSASKGDKRPRKLGPHFLYFARGSLYLVAEDAGDHQVKVFSLPRMSAAELLDEEYNGDVANPEEYFRGSLGVFANKSPVTVRVQFSPTVAPYIKERRWHSSQGVVTKADRSIVVTLEVGITPELVQWVLGFGSEARVLEPEPLKKAIVDAANRILSTYGGKEAA